MKHLCKLAFLPALFLLLTVNSANAAFPTEKQKGPEVSLVSNASSPETKSLTKSELKKELKALKSESAAKGSEGGSKSKILAAVLALLVGTLGIHSFYMGQKKKGFLQLGLTVVGLALFIAGIAGYVSGGGVALPTLALVGYIIIVGVGIWALVDFVRILTGSLAPEEGFSD